MELRRLDSVQVGPELEAWVHAGIAQGFRPGNFKPSAETIEAIEKVMHAAGVTPPAAPPREPTKPVPTP